MIIDGVALAQEKIQAVAARAKSLHKPPALHAVAIGSTPQAASYLAIKQRAAEAAGIHFSLVTVDTSDLAGVTAALTNPEADGILLQLPLPAGCNASELIAHIPVHKDADVLTDHAYALFATGTPGALLPPVAGAIRTILTAHQVNTAGAAAVVVGAGKLVGTPAAALLRSLGAAVTVLDADTFASGRDMLAAADIVVTGVGQPGLIEPNMLKEGVVLIDAGTSELGGKIVGDTNPACADIASVYAGVPGGVGPLTVAYLLENTVLLAERARG